MNIYTCYKNLWLDKQIYYQGLETISDTCLVVERLYAFIFKLRYNPIRIYLKKNFSR